MTKNKSTIVLEKKKVCNQQNKNVEELRDDEEEVDDK